jgi:hypothetical protein
MMSNSRISFDLVEFFNKQARIRRESERRHCFLQIFIDLHNISEHLLKLESEQREVEEPEQGPFITQIRQLEVAPIHCAVCLRTREELNGSFISLKATFCGHIICMDCSNQLIRQHQQLPLNDEETVRCPVCRQNLLRHGQYCIFTLHI